MDDPTTVATPGVQGEGSPTARPAAQPADGGVQPGAEGRPEGALPEDVHPAVREERERAQRYRAALEEVYVLDANGQPVGIRREFADHVQSQLQPAGGPEPDAARNARVDAAVTQFADKYGLLPEQVRGFVELARQIAADEFASGSQPLYEQSIEGMKAALIASGEVPREAAPHIDRWVAEAVKANPRAALTPAGRETILRQALGEYALLAIRRRRAVRPASSAANTPTLLRPTPGGVRGPAPTPEEAVLRKRMGLPEHFTEHTPKEGF